MLPASHPFHGLRADPATSEHEGEETLPEESLQAAEIDVFHGFLEPVGTKEAEAKDRVSVGVRRQLVSVALRGNDHRRDSFPASGDGKVWTEVHLNEVAKGGTSEIKLAPTEARHVRVRGTQRGTQWGHAVRELQVFE